MKDTKEHILKRSIVLFLQKSFKEVTMKEIVEATQMSKGAFYHYFGTKEQIFLEIVENIYARLINIDYRNFTRISLRAYYEDYLSHLSDSYGSLLEGDVISSFDLNYYSLVFDAIRFFPEVQAEDDFLVVRGARGLAGNHRPCAAKSGDRQPHDGRADRGSVHPHQQRCRLGQHGGRKNSQDGRGPSRNLGRFLWIDQSLIFMIFDIPDGRFRTCE